MHYYTCPHCGSNLDPGERCDCTKHERRPNMKRRYYLNERDVATLILVNISLDDVLSYSEIDPDIRDELESLSPKLDSMVMNLKRENPAHTPAS